MDSSGSTAIVALVTPSHVIAANAGDSRALLITVAEPKTKARTTTTSNSNSNASGSSNKITDAKGAAAAAAVVRSAANEEGGSVSDFSAATEKFAEALGLRLKEGGDTGKGGVGDDVSRTSTDDGVGAVGSVDSGSPKRGNMNDSVRLEEDDEEEEEDDGVDLNFEGADKLREMLNALMLGDGDAARSAVGESKGDQNAFDGGGGGGGDGEDGGFSSSNKVEDEGRGKGTGTGGGGERGRKVEVAPVSWDHTAKDEGEKARVTAAGGRVFEVEYKEADGTDSVVSTVGRTLTG